MIKMFVRSVCMYRKFVKRVLDVLVVLFILIVFAIPMILIAIAIKLEDHGPVFFRQERTGRYGKVFRLIKFRSMKVDNDVHDFKCADKHTKVGSFLRKTSLDELPQVFNILKGEMSFIGPRPWIPDYYENMNAEQRKRVNVRPGITGLAQAKGRNGLTIFEKIKFDVHYVENLTFFEDCKVIFLTIVTVLSGKGADAGKETIKNELDALKQEKTAIHEGG
ncbi:TPA: sugar transferase [Candidatus Ventrenecus stercoripullorum]|nr:sugar transferase [Candidatus Ventrenecus stercoripullorum]